MPDKSKVSVATIEHEGKQSLVLTFTENGKEHEVVLDALEAHELIGRLVVAVNSSDLKSDPMGALEGLTNIVRSGKASIKHQQFAASAIGHVIAMQSALGIISLIESGEGTDTSFEERRERIRSGARYNGPSKRFSLNPKGD